MRERRATNPSIDEMLMIEPPPEPDHFVHHGLGAQENRLVDVEGVAPAFEFELAHRFTARDAGVVDQDIESAEPPDRSATAAPIARAR